jgi:exopolysaccharide biosynthesis operon protein EpsL
VRAQGRLRACAFGLGYVGVVAAAVSASPALALWDGKLTPFVEEKITRDDNVFRLSKNVDPVGARGSTSPGDTYTTTSLGITLDAPLSRQRFQAGYTWSATRYSQFSDLDFNGHDARAIWLWQLGNDLSGQLGYTENFALAPFQYTQSRTPDPLRSRAAFLNGAYLLTPRWRIQAGGGVFDQKNGDPALQPNDINISSADASLSYVTPANSSIGLSGRVEEGRYPNRTFVAGSPFDDSYRQASAGFVGDWTVSGVSHLAGRVARLSRRYPNTPQSDFDGNVAVLEYDWKVTGKLTLTGVVRRDISPFQDIQSSFVLVRGATVRPTLSVTEKIDLSAVLDYSIWDYLGDPGLVAGGALGRVDRVRSGTASLSYKPLRGVTLQASVMRESRTSNLPTADYLANVASLTARLAF